MGQSEFTIAIYFSYLRAMICDCWRHGVSTALCLLQQFVLGRQEGNKQVTINCNVLNFYAEKERHLRSNRLHNLYCSCNLFTVTH